MNETPFRPGAIIRALFNRLHRILLFLVEPWTNIKHLRKLAEHQEQLLGTFVRVLQEAKEFRRQRAQDLEFLRKCTSEHVSWVPGHTPNLIVTLGTFHDRDFVEVTPVCAQDFENVVRHMQEIRRRTSPGRLDTPFEVSATIRRDLIPKIHPVRGEENEKGSL